MVNLFLPLLGTSLPADHGYALYGSLARLAPSLHASEAPILIGPVPGDYTGDGTLRLNPGRSFLRLRMPAEQIALVLPLAGKALEVAGHRVRLGVPRVLPIIPAPSLVARMVTIKKSDRQDRKRTTDYMLPEHFLEAVRRMLREQDVHGAPALPLVTHGPHAGKPRRHVMRIHYRKVVGFSVQVTGLSAEESVRLQEQGLGGRKKMGCGFFVPMRMA